MTDPDNLHRQPRQPERPQRHAGSPGPGGGTIILCGECGNPIVGFVPSLARKWLEHSLSEPEKDLVELVLRVHSKTVCTDNARALEALLALCDEVIEAIERPRPRPPATGLEAN